MKIEFSKEERAIGNAVTSIVENAPTAVAKTGVSVAGTALGIGWGLGKAMFGAAKVLSSAALDGIASAQLKMQEAQLKALAEQQAKMAAQQQQQQKNGETITVEAKVV